VTQEEMNEQCRIAMARIAARRDLERMDAFLRIAQIPDSQESTLTYGRIRERQRELPTADDREMF